MHAVVRSYSGQGASELFGQLEQRNEEVKDLIGGVPGFVSYTAFRSGEGGSSTRANPPVITEGSTVVHFSS